MDKEKVIQNFNNMIKRSWTYNRLTEKEKEKWNETINHTRSLEIIKGTAKQRWNILNGLYFAFLNGCGYNSYNCREPDPELTTKF